jgi:dihydropyrimidinase
VIKNANVVIPYSGIVKGGIAVKEGKVVAVSSEANLPNGGRTVDAKGNYLLPGCVDPHVHYGHTYGRYSLDLAENLVSETISAAIGGVTTVNVIHRLSPPTASYFDFFKEKIEGASRASVDFTLTVGIMTDAHVDEMEGYAEKLGVISFKFFRGYKGREAQEIGATGLDDGTLYAMLMKVKLIGSRALALVHCENAEIIRYMTDIVRSKKKMGLEAWTEARPDIAEVDSVRSAIYLAHDVAKTRLYVPHVSSGAGLEAVAEAKAAGKEIIAETCPHYLAFTKDSKIGVLGKINPPLRDGESVQRLWRGVLEGTIDTIGTDHVPVRLKDKLGDGDIWSAGLAFPGSATMLPFLISEGFHKRGLGLQRIAELTSSNPAKALGLHPWKGTFSVGADADFVLVDLKKEVDTSSEKLHSAAGFTLFEGWKMKGWPVTTFLRGEKVVEDGEYVGKEGLGRYLYRNVREEGYKRS